MNMQKNIFLISLVILSGVLISIISSYFLLRYSREQNTIEIERHFEIRAEQLQLNINNTLQTLASLSGLFYSSNHVTKSEFDKFVSISTQKQNSIISLAWVQLVKDKERSVFEKKISGRGTRGKYIYDINSHGLESIAFRQAQYYPIQYLYSEINSELFPGLNLGTQYKTKKRFQNAARSKQTLITEKIYLRKGTLLLPIVRAFKPVYNDETKSLGSLKGFVFGQIDIKELMESVFGNEDKLSILLFDIDSDLDKQKLYANQTANLYHSSINNINDIGEVSSTYWSRYYDIGNRRWLVTFIENNNNTTFWLPFLGLFFGLFFTFFLTIYMIIAWSKTQQVDELKKENKAKTRFLQAIGHDLRQPLNVIGLHITNYEQKNIDLSSENKTLLNNIRQSISGLHSMFTSLLDISRLEEGLIAPEFNRVRLLPLFTDLSDEFDLLANQKHIEIRMKCQDIGIHTDEILLERMLRNLLNNAIKYTDKGKIFFGARQTNEIVKIYIMDTGRGIADSEIETVLETYQRGSETGDIDGLGLGLAIVKQTVELLNMELEIHSKQNRGTTVIIKIKENNNL